MIYYLIPKKYQWIFLSGISLLFIFFCGGGIALGFILFSSLVVWIGTVSISKWNKAYDESVCKSGISKEIKKQQKKICRKKKLTVLLICLLLVFGVLAFFKYVNIHFNFIGVILPLGISFYTFQSAGYLMDVYWDKELTEKNYLRFFLFVSFFPQIIQGPIGRYTQLKEELYRCHAFDLIKIEKACILILWGTLKKIAIANRAMLISNGVFDSPEKYGGGMILIGLFFYSMYMYADFSGGIDIITGIAELFDIKLAENFNRPYFSKSLAEFWRRWHISLGAWMRDYVFYPLAISKGMRNLTKRLNKINTYLARYTNVIICNTVIFFLVGIWHGSDVHYIVWGLYNGVVISISAMAEPLFLRIKDRLHIVGQEKWYQVMCIVRTFLIVNIGWFFDGSRTITGAFQMIHSVFSLNFVKGLSVQSFVDFIGMDFFNLIYNAIIFWCAIIVLFTVSCLQEIKKISIRGVILQKPVWQRWLILYALIFFILFACSRLPEAAAGGFMYANF